MISHPISFERGRDNYNGRFISYHVRFKFGNLNILYRWYPIYYFDCFIISNTLIERLSLSGNTYYHQLDSGDSEIKCVEYSLT